jgi:DNA-binding response OmpR family regulator
MHILIADDDLPNLKLTSFLLEDAGYHTVRAHDGPTILRHLEQQQPDLVLLDVSMPLTNGFEICRQIRRTSDVPIIFLSARSQLEDRVRGLQVGGDDYLVKPFEPVELLARIEAVLRRRNSDMLSPATRLTQADLTLDPIEQKVLFVDGRSATLTPIEFRVLYYLMQNAGRVLSPTQILSKVWGYDFDGESNLVAVYMRRLRSKLEPTTTSPRYIVTIRNMGYKFAV